NEGTADAYVVATLLSVPSRQRLQELIRALDEVIDRHDSLRTAVIWEQFPRPMQVMHRRVSLPAQEVLLDPDRDTLEQVKAWLAPQCQRLNLRQAPLMMMQIAADPHSPTWYVLLQLHHVVCDHVAVDILASEVVAYVHSRQQSLPEPVPYCSHVAK